MKALNRIKNAFDTVRADEKLKKNTISFLQNERAKRESRSKFKYAYRYALALTVVFAALFGIGSYSVLNTSVSYISIDVNPSVELALNRFDNVVKTTAYNDDGEAILKNVNLNGKSYVDAIETLLSNQEFASYIRENSEIDFTVVSDNEDRIINGIQDCKGYGEYNGACHGADHEIITQAHNHGLSFGKYRAYLELFKYDSSVTADDCKNMTMSQIHDMISEHTNEHHSSEINSNETNLNETNSSETNLNEHHSNSHHSSKGYNPTQGHRNGHH